MNTLSGCPIRIGFGSLKGGTGKSTLAEITASYLCYTEGLRLFVVDYDYCTCGEGCPPFYGRACG